MSTPPPIPPDETRARGKYHCPSCGAEAIWNPDKSTLICKYCNTEFPAASEEAVGDESGEEAEIQEYDLLDALENIPESARGWQTKTTSVRCQSCNAISVFDASTIAKRCDFCGSAALVPYEDVKEVFRPESLLPLKISEVQVRENIRTWFQGRWLAPSNLAERSRTDTVRGVYLPCWTFDANAEADWSAQSGYYYYTTESYTDSQGKRQTRRVRHTRWVPSSGHVSHFFDDELAPASKGVDANLLSKIEPFPTDELVPYNPRYLAGWVVERYQVDLKTAAKAAHESMTSQVHKMCERQVPGDTHAYLRVSIRWSHQTFKHILAPVWVLAYDYRGSTYQLVVNGYTGKVAGRHPYSFIKVLLLTIACIGFGFLIFWFVTQMNGASRR